MGLFKQIFNNLSGWTSLKREMSELHHCRSRKERDLTKHFCLFPVVRSRQGCRVQ